MHSARLTPDLAGRFAAIALGHVGREYPNKLDHVLDGPQDLRGPRDLHPAFYGSFDWHSCVHAVWMLARLLRRFPDHAEAPAIRALLDDRINERSMAAERAYLDRPSARGFERPYGWGWLLKLAAELQGLEDGRWSRAITPLAEGFAARFRAFLPRADYPIRAGVHANTAFALRLAADYDGSLLPLFRDKARAWYGADADCQAWEPSGDDFLSSALIEAECLRRLLPRDEFLPWFDRFLPRIAAREPASLFTPARVADRSDGKIAHLDGLNLSRAWCWRALAAALPEADPRRPVMEAAAADHLAAGIAHVAGDYMGEHWLASFAVLALDED